MDGARIVPDQVLDGRRPLSHPGAAIEQFGRLQEWLDVDLHRHAAHRLQALDRLSEKDLGLPVAHEHQLVRPRDREPEARAQARRRRGRRPPRIGIGGVEARGDLVHQGRVGHVVGHHRHAVEAAAGRDHPAGAPPALGGLQADQAVERCGHPARAGCVGAQRKGHQPRPHRDARARARPAADIVEIVDAARLAIGASRPHQAGGELVEVGLAHQDRARSDQPRHHLGRDRRRIGIGRTGRRGRQAGHVDIVLHRERHAGQGQHLSGRNPGVHRASLGEDGLRLRPADPGLGLDGVIGRNGRQGLLGDGDGGPGAGRDLGGDADDGGARAHAGSTAIIGAPGAMGWRSWA